MEKFNAIKNTTLVDRVKRAVDAFKGNQVGNLYFERRYSCVALFVAPKRK